MLRFGLGVAREYCTTADESDCAHANVRHKTRKGKNEAEYRDGLHAAEESFSANHSEFTWMTDELDGYLGPDATEIGKRDEEEGPSCLKSAQIAVPCVLITSRRGPCMIHLERTKFHIRSNAKVTKGCRTLYISHYIIDFVVYVSENP